MRIDRTPPPPHPTGDVASGARRSQNRERVRAGKTRAASTGARLGRGAALPTCLRRFSRAATPGTPYASRAARRGLRVARAGETVSHSSAPRRVRSARTCAC
eukprot:925647-Prymnesium_polylepis.1